MRKYPKIKYVKENKKRDAWKYIPGSRLGIFRKFLISFLLIAILPLLVFGIYSYMSISEVGTSSVENVRRSLDNKTREALELQASMVAERVKEFLNDRVTDLRYLTDLSADTKTYLVFYRSKKSLVWLPDGSGSRESGIKKYKYLYKEISFIDNNGNEQIKIRDGSIVSPKGLKNVSLPENTLYKGEVYFIRAKLLSGDNIYVSHLNGFFVTPDEQFRDSADIKDFKISKYYDGVIRFVMPKYSGGKLKGYVVLALDHIHLMEFTQHILPNSKDKVVFPNYDSGDYAFIFDDEGWIITHPKFWDIRGFYSNGKPVPAYSKNTPYSIVKKGYIPFNLDSAGFIHNNYPFVANAIREHRSGSVVTKNVGGILKVMAYAPIEFNVGGYSKFGVFGGVTIGSEIHRFRGSAELVATELHDKLLLFLEDLFFFTFITFIVIIFVAWFFSKSYSDPIRKLTEEVKKFSEGDLNASVQLNRNDELGILSNSFNVMAYELKKSREELLKYVEDLKESKNQVETYASDLEYQLVIFSTIQKISNLLGSTFDFDTIIREILKNCVDAIGFDRAILYLIDENGKYLEYQDSYGFTVYEKKYAEKSKYNLNRADCIETKVAVQGEIIFVEKFSEFKNATELDKKIHRIAKSESFVYLPLRVKEKIIGIMGADKKNSGSPIIEKDINSLQVLANQASRVIETTMLYREIIRQRNFVEDIFENMLNGLFTTDGKGNITSHNSAARRILEFDGDIVGQNVYELFPLNVSLIDEMTKQLEEKGAFNSYVTEVEIKGKIKYLSFNISRIVDADDKRTSTIVVIQDQTERKHLEDHVQKMDRLISLGKFAAGIAHEIRNPLTGISLFLDDIHDRLHGDENLSLLIRNSLNEISRLENLIEEILDFATPSKGERRETDVNQLVNSTVSFIEKQFIRKKKKIITKLKPDLPLIKSDAEKLRQAFLNIILNAENAIDEGGRLLVSTSLRKIKFADREKIEKYVVVEFEDDGPGIKPEEREHLFEPFYSGFNRGTGLGLSIVETIISEHNGKVIIEDSSLGGAKFSVYLSM